MDKEGSRIDSFAEYVINIASRTADRFILYNVSNTRDDICRLIVSIITPCTNNLGIPHLIEHLIIKSISKKMTSVIKGETFTDKTLYFVSNRSQTQLYKDVQLLIMELQAPSFLNSYTELVKEIGGIEGVNYGYRHEILSAGRDYKFYKSIENILFSSTPYSYDGGGKMNGFNYLSSKDVIAYYKSIYKKNKWVFVSTYMGDADCKMRNLLKKNIDFSPRLNLKKNYVRIYSKKNFNCNKQSVLSPFVDTRRRYLFLVFPKIKSANDIIFFNHIFTMLFCNNSGIDLYLNTSYLNQYIGINMCTSNLTKEEIMMQIKHSNTKNYQQYKEILYNSFSRYDKRSSENLQYLIYNLIGLTYQFSINDIFNTLNKVTYYNTIEKFYLDIDSNNIQHKIDEIAIKEIRFFPKTI